MDISSQQKFPPEFMPHFEGLGKKVVCFPRCLDCGQFHWYPMPLCPYCRSSSIEWKAVTGHTRLYSWTVVHHAFSASLSDLVPYVVALVVFDDAPNVRLVTNLKMEDHQDFQINMLLQPVFHDDQSNFHKVTFRPI